MASPEIDTRPVRADKARNRERVLQAAREAFGVHGIDTAMDDVAARAGVGVGTVYRHFPTKEALMGELVRQKFELITANAREGLAQEGEPFEVFAGVLRRSCEETAKDAAAQHALMGAGDEVWEHAEATRAELHVVIQELIVRAQAAGTMRQDFGADDMPMLMCGVSASMAHGGWEWARHLEIVLDGLRARPGPTPR
jgi:AcrR family transcriptional regulator